MQIADPLWTPARGDDACAFLLKQPRNLEPDSTRRAGDDANLFAKAEIHGGYLSLVTTILLVRHAETDWNRTDRWQGHADPRLNATGLRQADQLARELSRDTFDAIYSSDLRRAYETADAIARGRRLEVVRDHDLREIDVGEWSGLTTAEIQSRHPDGFSRHLLGGDGWERGETHATMSARVISAMTRIAEAHPDGRVLCVLHGGPIRALLAHADGIDLGEWRRTRRGPDNADVEPIVVEHGVFRRAEP